MPSSEARAPARRATIAVAMPKALRQQFFTPSTWNDLLQWADVSVPADDAPDALLAMLETIPETDVIVTGWGTPVIDASTLDRVPSLRAVVHTAGSVKKIVAPEVYRRGVHVSSQVANNAVPVAEYTLAMVILALKGVLHGAHIYERTRSVPEVYRLLAGHGTYRRTVGLVGASRVGRRVIELLKPLDVDAVVYDPYLPAEAAAELGVRSVSLDELASVSDVISIHAPALEETVGMISRSFLARMRDGATLINTARGALVDEPALVAELVSGRLSAILDVTDPAVPSMTSPLWELPNVLLTPHVAGAAGSELQRLGDAAIEEVRRVAAGEPLLHEVSWESLGVIA